jgi:hypothetical protein
MLLLLSRMILLTACRFKLHTAVHVHICRTLVLTCAMPTCLLYAQTQDFYSCKRLEEVTLTCEKEFASVFCGGNTAQARGMLLPQKLDESVDWGQFQLGYHLGMAALLVSTHIVYIYTYTYI